MLKHAGLFVAAALSLANTSCTPTTGELAGVKTAVDGPGLQLCNAELGAEWSWICTLADTALDIWIARERGATPQAAPATTTPPTRKDRELELKRLLSKPRAA